MCPQLLPPSSSAYPGTCALAVCTSVRSAYVRSSSTFCFVLAASAPGCRFHYRCQSNLISVFTSQFSCVTSSRMSSLRFAKFTVISLTARPTLVKLRWCDLPSGCFPGNILAIDECACVPNSIVAQASCDALRVSTHVLLATDRLHRNYILYTVYCEVFWSTLSHTLPYFGLSSRAFRIMLFYCCRCTL